MSLSGISTAVEKTTSFTTNALVKGSGTSSLQTTGISCDSSNNLTGVNNISTISQINGSNGSYLEFIDETFGNAPSIRGVSGQPWQIGGSHSSDLNAHMSLGYFPAINAGLLYAFRQGDGAKNMQYGYPGFPVGHIFEGRIQSSTSQLNNLDIPSHTGRICTFESGSVYDMMMGATISSSGTVLTQSGGVSCVQNSTGNYTVSLSCQSSTGAQVTFSDSGKYGFIRCEQATSASWNVIILSAGQIAQDSGFTFLSAVRK